MVRTSRHTCRIMQIEKVAKIAAWDLLPWNRFEAGGQADRSPIRPSIAFGRHNRVVSAQVY